MPPLMFNSFMGNYYKLALYSGSFLK